MTQGQVAARCGLTSQEIQKYEAGSVGLPFARLVQLAQVLQAPLSEFTEGLPCASPTLASVNLNE